MRYVFFNPVSIWVTDMVGLFYIYNHIRVFFHLIVTYARYLETFKWQNVVYKLHRNCVFQKTIQGPDRYEPEYKNGGNMRLKSVISFLIVLVLMISAAHAATSTTTSDSSLTPAQDAASQVYISSVKIDPEVFYPYEQGTITITLTNSGTSSVGLSNPDILSEKIHIMNQDRLEHHEFYRTGIIADVFISCKGRSPGWNLFPAFYGWCTKCREYPLSSHDQS